MGGPAIGPSPSLGRGDFPRAAAAYFTFFFSNSCFLLLPLYFQQLGAGEGLIGALAAAHSLATLFALPAAGLLAPRWGGWALMLAGALGQAVSAVGFLLAPGPHFPLFGFLRFLQGCAFSFVFTGSLVVATAAAPRERRAQAFGWLGMMAPFAQAVAPRAGEGLVGWGGYPSLFAFALAWALLSVAVSVAALRRGGGGAARAAAPRPGPAFALTLRREHRANHFAGFCFGFAFGAMITFAPLAIGAAGLPAVGFFFTVQGATVALARLFLGSLADRFGRRRVILPNLALLALSLAFLGAAGSAPAFAASGLLNGLAHGLLFPAMMALAVDRTGPEAAGSMVATFGGVFNAGTFVSGLLLGPVAEAFGYGPLFAVSSALMWAGFLAFLLWDPRG